MRAPTGSNLKSLLAEVCPTQELGRSHMTDTIYEELA